MNNNIFYGTPFQIKLNLDLIKKILDVICC